MNRQSILKFSAINNLSDARYAAGSWADFIGFCFDPSDASYIEPAKASEIISWVKGPVLCGEFGHQPKEWIMDFVKSLSLTAVQIPSDYPFDDLFGEQELKFIIRVDDLNQNRHFNKADLFISDRIDICNALQDMYDKPVLMEVKDLNQGPGESDGIVFKGGKEDIPGTRNHSEWTDYIEKWLEDSEQ